MRAEELVDIAVDDPVRLVAIAREGRQLVGGRVLRDVPFGKREPHDRVSLRVLLEQFSGCRRSTRDPSRG